MPQAGETPEMLEKEFGSKQKTVLKAKYKAVLREYLDKYSIEWNKLGFPHRSSTSAVLLA